MKFPLFAIFIVFIIWLAIFLKKKNREDNAASESFWAREKRANEAPAKSLSDLAYITVPFEELPMDTLSGDEEAEELGRTIRSFEEKKTVNLTGLSNTDLKLMYGASNLEKLSAYDQNYTLLARSLQKWAALLHKKNRDSEAITVLEFAISTYTDISSSYALLAELYKSAGTPEKINDLIPIAESLNTPMKASILKSLT